MGELEAAQPDGEIEPGADQKRHEGRPPDEVVDPLVKIQKPGE